MLWRGEEANILPLYLVGEAMVALDNVDIFLPTFLHWHSVFQVLKEKSAGSF